MPRCDKPARFTFTKSAVAQMGVKAGEDFMSVGYDIAAKTIVVARARETAPKDERWPLTTEHRGATPGVCSREIVAFLLEHGLHQGWDYPVQIADGAAFLNLAAGKLSNQRPPRLRKAA
jgi:hypothetical protein